MYQDTDEFLEHFGVKGMKWGQTRKMIKAEKKAAFKSQQLIRGKSILAKNKGNATIATAKLIGKQLGTEVLAGAGAMAVNKLSTNTSVRTGAAIAAKSTSYAMLYSNVRDAQAIRAAVVDRKNNG